MDIAALKAAAEAIKSSDYHDLDAYLSAANPTSILSMIARLEALEEALKPFAKYAELREASNIFDDELICGIHGADGSATVTFGDFRKARAALEPTP